MTPIKNRGYMLNRAFMESIIWLKWIYAVNYLKLTDVKRATPYLVYLQP